MTKENLILNPRGEPIAPKIGWLTRLWHYKKYLIAAATALAFIAGAMSNLGKIISFLDSIQSETSQSSSAANEAGGKDLPLITDALLAPLVIVPPVNPDDLLVNPNPPRPENPGIRVIEDHRTVDLRGHELIPETVNARKNPATFIRRVTLLRESHSATLYRARFSTSGYTIDARCTSGQPFQREVAGFGGNVREKFLMQDMDVVVDLSNEEIDKEIHIVVEATLWNSYHRAEEWAGFDSYELKPVKVKSMRIIFPTNRPAKKYWFEFTGGGASQLNSDNLFHRISQDRLQIFWKLEGSPLDNWIATRWEW